ncbi:MAG: hypothetical protein LC800_20545 [Acidobacteria bacterium]|nr:hypothetical protein [Acidobacteriota bacterium]
MMNLDQDTMRQVVEAAFNSTNSLRWQVAITRAAQILESNPSVHLDGDTLLMLSDSGEIYEVKSGSCPCKAFRQGQPCKHRAARQLLIRYNETSH